MSTFSPPQSAQPILESRYYQPGETWEALCRRVAKAVVQAEDESRRPEWEDRFFSLLSEGKMLPNTPALVNLGTARTGSAAACFIFRPEDSMVSIMETARLAAMTLKYGGGIGFELSLLRPAGSTVHSTHKYAMGPVGVLRFYNAVGDMVTQAGIRKAALLALLRIDHPDIIRFCTAKEKDRVLANFNISVSIPDSFMKKLVQSPLKPHVAAFGGKQFHILPDGTPIPRSDRGTQKVLSTEDIWAAICSRSASNGDPAPVFIDHVNRNNPLIAGPSDTENPYYLHGVNACSEIASESMNSCILASVDLAKFVRDDSLDIDALGEAFSTTTRFLDNMIDVSSYPDPAVREVTLRVRRIGVGVMGFTSMLDKLRVRFASPECMRLIEEIGLLRERTCSLASQQLAEERGVYPAAKVGETHRNIARTVVAPTGSLAMIAGTSWSIEPHLYWAFTERRNDTERFRFLPTVEETLSQERLSELTAESEGDIAALNTLVQAALPEHMSLSKDITPEQRIAVVAAWQKHTDNGISQTIILPEGDATQERVSKIFRLAWESKLKGITVYPEGSRAGEPMSIGKKRVNGRKRPKRLTGTTTEHELFLSGKAVKAFCTINHAEGKSDEPYEVLIKHPYVEDPVAIQFIDLSTRLISMLLRYHRCDCGGEAIPLGQVIKQLRDTDGRSLFSVPSILVEALSGWLPPGETVGKCPQCNGELTMVEGCETCLSCHYRACG
jgi:ribonucleoside-diphosphate reductase alpha chain